jgi:hypothetical protein
MKGRTLALFLLVYLTLDLANPFMPGVVTFVDGRLEVIDTNRPAGIALPVLNSVGTAGALRGEPALTQPSTRTATAGERLRRWWFPARRAFSIAREPASSSDDH